ncbi:Alpha/beta hydrolase fold-1 [Hypomontagnella monticulosa]|nr:Alpha/beta hydrolase fold-1 [Hypomontagnella monticulosa]
MTSTKLTVVLVHGAWHVPASYDKLVAALTSAGYEVYVPRLTSVSGTRPPDGDLITDTAVVRSCVEGLVETGHTVIALLHSYGGQVGTNALHGLSYEMRRKQGLSGGVSHLIYMCGFILPEGWSTLNQAQSQGIEDIKTSQLKLAFDEEGYCSMAEPREQLINGVKDDAEAAAYISTLMPWSAKCMTQPLSHCAWKEIPVTYIHTTDDKTLSLASQKLMLERAKELGLQDLVVVTLDTDHCPHLTAVDGILSPERHVLMSYF